MTEIRLLTNGDFSANIALYKAIGYRVDRVDEFMGGKAVYMAKKLV